MVVVIIFYILIKITISAFKKQCLLDSNTIFTKKVV